MNQQEAEMLKDVWQLVVPDKVTHGVELFVRLFDQCPETKELFRRLPKDPAEMRRSARMRAHATRVMTSLGSIIEQADDQELMGESIYLLGDSHARHGATKEHFQKLSKIIVEYLSAALGEKLTPERGAVVVKFLDILTTETSQYLSA